MDKKLIGRLQAEACGQWLCMQVEAGGNWGPPGVHVETTIP